MEAIPGFVSIPRLAGSSRPAGAFFSAVVEAQTGTGTFRVLLDGRPLVVTTDLPLAVGQALKLKLVSAETGLWKFKVVPEPVHVASSPDTNTLMAAFLSKGLPLTSERLTAWTRWLAKAGPSDKESWAASLEARGEKPHGNLAEQLNPWLLWQSELEKGENLAPPEDDSVWDEWNLRRAKGEMWLAMPLRWEHRGLLDSGLLQARWNDQSRTIDRWHLTAAPASTPFRLEVRSTDQSLDMVWHFFIHEHRVVWQSWVEGHGAALSSPGLRVNLRVAGPPPPLKISRGVDVQI